METHVLHNKLVKKLLSNEINDGERPTTRNYTRGDAQCVEMQKKYRLIKCTLTAIELHCCRVRKRNSPYTLHAVLLESRVIVLHAEVMFIRQLGTQVQ